MWRYRISSMVLYGKEELAQFNCSHKVNSLWFGSKERGDVNTLDGYEKNMNASDGIVCD